MALGADRQEIVIRFRPVPHLPFMGPDSEPDVLRLSLSPDAIALEINLNGGTLSISDVEAEESWRIVEPVLAAWAAGTVPLQEYPPERRVRRAERHRDSGMTATGQAARCRTP